MTTKDRAFLKGLAMNITPVLSLGKSSLTPEFVKAAEEALVARELIKINVLKNCEDDIHAIAETLAERSRSEVVQIIGRKIVLYKRNHENTKIYFPGEKRPNDKRK
jgi:putative RNA-binding protein, YhbY family